MSKEFLDSRDFRYVWTRVEGGQVLGENVRGYIECFSLFCVRTKVHA